MEIRFKGKSFKLLRTERLLPNGQRVQVDMIDHPGAVVIVPVLAKDKLVLLRQYRVTMGQFLYELPAGTLKPGEAPQLCARRELTEETNFRARGIKKLGCIIPVPGYSNEIIHVFLATGLTPALGHPDADEILEPLILNRSQIRKLFKTNQICDAKSICGLVMGGWI